MNLTAVLWACRRNTKPYKPETKKLLRVMRLTAIILFAACLQISAKGLTQQVTLSVKNATLDQVFAELRKQTGYEFFYNTAMMQKAKKVTLNVKAADIKAVLDICFAGQPLDYTIFEKTIIVKEKTTNPNADGGSEQLPPPIDIHGRILNEKGEPVAASILVKGTNKGTSTNDNGEFELKGVDDNATLVISGVSIESFEVKVNGRSELTLNARVRASVGEEVIINKGYYTTSRRMNTGNVSRVSSVDIQKQPISNPLEAIEGRMPGVYVQQTSGVSGSGFNVEIRGRNSLRTSSTDNGNLPLYIIDGVPITSTSLDISTGIGNQIIPLGSPLNSLNSSDVESIEILKDADATAIYGSRGANGVVLITTKRGKAGKTKLDLNFYSGAGQVSQTMDLLNSQQFLAMRREAYKNDGGIPQPYDVDLQGIWDTTRYTDWQKLLIGGTAQTLSLQASVSGGNENTQFLFGGGYFKQGTVFPGNFSDQKISSHLSVNHSSENKKFTSSVSVNYLVDNNNQPNSDPTIRALSLSPVAPKIYNDDGSLNWANSTWDNPMSYFLLPFQVNGNNLISNVTLGYKILPELQLKLSAGYNNTELHQKSLTPIFAQNPAVLPTGIGNFSENNFSSWIAEPQMEYKKTIAKGDLSILVGSTFQQNTNQSQKIFASGFTSDALLENPASAARVTPSTFYSQYKYNAVFSRINYTWNEKYLINLTGRRDGSSRFGPGKQFANFGAMGIGWIFSNEKWLSQAIPFLSFGKIRGSYGSTGSDQIPDYGYLDTYASVTPGYNGVPSFTINRLFNADYAWEENKKIELAVELGFLNDKIFVSSSYYRNRSSNQLVGYPLPTMTGQPSLPFFNLPATVQNTGLEFEVRTVNIENKNLRWSTFINLTLPKNKLIAYPNLATSSYSKTYLVGQPIYGSRTFQYTGVNPQTGLFTFEDVDKSNSISSPNDLTSVTPVSRNYYGGLQNNLSFKGFQVDFLLQFVKQTGVTYLTFFQSPGTLNNQPTYVLNRWQKAGDNTDVQRFSISGAGNSAYQTARNTGSNRVGDASFIRLKNVSLSYNLSTIKILHGKFQLLRLYVQGQNLFTITNYLGLDPETQSFQNIPPLRLITAGIQITL